MRDNQRRLGFPRRFRTVIAAMSVLGVVAGGVTTTSATAEATVVPGPRVDLRVLVVSDGGGSVSAIAGALHNAGLPFTTVNLADANRPSITAGFLADTVNGVARAKYQAVVLPNENPFTDPAEMSALAAYETKYNVRQVNAYTWANPAVGMNYAGYVGTLDGVTATATPAARAGAFRYLRGPVAFDDIVPNVAESYGYVATPMADDPARNSHFEPYLTVTAPDGTTGSIAGVYTHDGRSEFVTTFAYSAGQQQFRLLAHGMVTWMTRGIHLGYERNYFSVHVDDIFLGDSRWSIAGHCTIGEGCAANDGGDAEIRMSAADAAYAKTWQQQNGFMLDFFYNAAGSVGAITANGSDPLTDYLVANRNAFRWSNHTYSHKFLGCKQDFTVVPWKCATDPATGAVIYMSKAEIADQIAANTAWAAKRGIAVPKDEIVTGEHSGLLILPQQPTDNPNLISAFSQTGIAWAGSDASRDPRQRQVGPALTVPRHPINIFFNVARTAEEIAEYNWIYTSRADGGSGVCEDNAATVTCIAPLGADGFTTKIVPTETRTAMAHILANDPAPHYVHQGNITEDRLLYPMLDSVLRTYRSAFAANTPLVNQRMSANGAEMARQAAWDKAVAAGKVTAYLQNRRVTVQAPAGLAVPLTMPEGTNQVVTTTFARRIVIAVPSVFGNAYAGERSAYVRIAANQQFMLAPPVGA